MKRLLANVANRVLTAIARRQAITGCIWGCYEQELPEELEQYKREYMARKAVKTARV
ncbi:AgrD family cyclic lactone autoinducer peptide [Paenibacillus sedimenti]|uniref:Cyclic lactone autoinducer peptide n=1 Tax=Paenibacillus sedimenti TaxID=2770274 RepID=A0A926QIT6_9BACL|nr:cyclic lactone autoinducer peptide [Paenibacillus sedimenti]MBD0379677.1 cyclic lactone autoinducer peptide [Paenibacillus sedimenti]